MRELWMKWWRRRNRRLVRILLNVVGDNACERLANVPTAGRTANDGWNACATTLRARLQRAGYLP